MNSDFLKRLIPAVVEAAKESSLTREIVAMALEELGKQIRAGEHLPDETLDRANEDQLLLDKAFDS